jgi:hypothetical protein
MTVPDRRTALAGLVALLLPLQAGAQSPGERRRDIPVAPAARDSLVQQVASLVRRYYVDSTAARRMADAVERRWRQGAYARFDSGAGLVGALTGDLRQVHADEHLRLDYFVVPRPMRGAAGTASNEDLEARRRVAARRGFGIERVERLPGNVAVVTLRSFEPPSIGGAALQAAMSLTAGADAMVLDLRQNGGGYGEMVGELAAYFAPGGTPWSEGYDRVSGRAERTVVPSRAEGPVFRGRPLFIVTSRRTFSAAEAFAYAMRARGLATVVGDTTRGGANPVQVFQLSPHFALFLPTGRATDLATHTNWEGRGVAPDVVTPAAGAVTAAYRRALEALLAGSPSPDVADEIRDALSRLSGAQPGAP